MRFATLALTVVAALSPGVAGATAYIVPDLRYVQATVVQPWIFAPSSGVPVTITGVGGSDSLDITGTAPSAVAGGAGTPAGTELNVVGAAGGATAGAGSTAGVGASITLTTGTGGAATNGAGAGVSGAGGTLSLTTGGGGLTSSAAGTGGAGGPINITAGNGTAGGVTTGGAGGTIQIFAGAGANGSTTGGNGGNVILRCGAAGTGGAPTNGVVIARAPAASYGTTFAVQTNLGASNFTVTDAGAFTASAASTISANNGTWPTASLNFTNGTGGAIKMPNTAGGASTTGTFSNGDKIILYDDGTSKKAIGMSGLNTTYFQNVLTSDNSYWTFLVGTTNLFYIQSTSVGSVAGGVTLVSNASSGANTGFTLSLSNSPTTLLNGNSSQYVLPGAAPASVAGSGTAAINGVLTGSAGGASSGTTGQTGGTGSTWTITGGTGGAVAGASGIGGAGGAITGTAGNGGNGAATGGAGGNVNLTAGNAGTGGNANGGSISLTSGAATGSGTAGTITHTGLTTMTFASVANGATLNLLGTGGTGTTNINVANGAAFLHGSSTNGFFEATSDFGTANQTGRITVGSNSTNHGSLAWNTSLSNLAITSKNDRISFINDSNGVEVGRLSLGTGASPASFVVVSDVVTGANTGLLVRSVNSPTTAFQADANNGTNVGLTVPGSPPASVAGSGTNAINGVFTGSAGGATSGTTGQTAGTGSQMTITGGAGGAATGASGANVGGAALGISLVGGAGGAVTSATGTGGAGGPVSNVAGNGSGTGATGGAGGAQTLTAGNGGNGSTTGGVGGNVTITGGNAGTGGNANGGSVTITSGTVTGTGTASVVLKTGTNATAGVTFQQSDGTIYATADSSNKRLRLGDATVPTATLDLGGTLTAAASSGLITRYSNEATAGEGVAHAEAQGYQVASAGGGAQNTTIATFSPAVAGLYEVWTVISTGTNVDTVTAVVTFTDAVNTTAQTVTDISAVALGANSTTSAVIFINANTSTAIVSKITVSSQTTTKASASINRVR